MPGQMTMILRADPGPYEDAIKRLSRATSEWELSTAAGADDVDEKFAEVIRALVDMERQGGRTEDDVKKALQGIGLSAEDAEDSLKAIDRELSTVGDNNGGKRAADDLDRVDSKAGDAGDGLRSLGDIATDVLSGDFSDAATTALDSLAQMVTDAGKVGGAIGGIAGVALTVAGETGLGLIMDAIKGQQEEANKLKERLSGAYKAALEAGRDYIDQSQLIAESNSLRFDPDRAEEWKKLQEDARRLGLSENDIIKANTGDLAAQSKVLRGIQDVKSDKRGDAYYVTERDGLLKLKPEYRDMESRWDAINDASKKYARNVEAAARSNSAFLIDAIEGAKEATVAVDKFGNRVYSLPDGTQVFIDAKTGKATEDLSRFEGDLDEVGKKVANPTVKVKLDTSEVDNYVPEIKTSTVVYSAQGNVRQRG